MNTQCISPGEGTVKMPIWAQLRIANNFATDIEMQDFKKMVESDNNITKKVPLNIDSCSTYCQTTACQVHCGGSSQIPSY